MRTNKALTYDIVVDNMTIRITHKPVRNINLRIGSGGQPQMSVPQTMSRAQATKLAREHAPWFAQSLERLRKVQTARPVRWESGERISWWGKELELKVDTSGGRAFCEERADSILMHAPATSTPQERAELFEDFCVASIKAKLVNLLPDCERRVGRVATRITLRRMKTRWGSCTPRTGRIRLNIALAECPEPCLETVLVHELCHMRVANHSAQFYACMDLFCPSWRVHQHWLDTHSPGAL